MKVSELKKQLRITRPFRDGAWQKRSEAGQVINRHGVAVGLRSLVIDDGSSQIQCDHRELPFADGSIDQIEIAHVLEYVRDDAALYSELARILRPGGLLHLEVPKSGLLAGFDSLNLYKYAADIFKRGWRLPETEEIGFRRHLSAEEVLEALGPGFAISYEGTRGLALSELLNVTAMIALTFTGADERKYLRVRPRIQQVTRLERRLHAGRYGFWLVLDLVKQPDHS